MRNIIIIVLTTLISGYGLSGQETARAVIEEEEYCGLRTELNQADGVLRITVDDSKPVNLPPNWDWRKGPAEEIEITGTVMSSFKGELAKPGDKLTLRIRYAENRRRYERVLYGLGQLFFSNIPGRKDNCIFLVRELEKKLEVINMICSLSPSTLTYTNKELHEKVHGEMRQVSDAFVKKYVEISQAKPEEAALQITELICREALYSEDLHYGARHKIAVCLLDWGLLYPDLPQKSEAFEKILKSHYPRVLKIARNPNNFDELYYAVWLTTLMPESYRKEIVKAFLESHELIEKRMREILNNPPRQSEELTAEQAEAMKIAGIRNTLLFAIEITVNPSLVDPKKFYLLPIQTRKNPEQILNEAKEFIKE